MKFAIIFFLSLSSIPVLAQQDTAGKPLAEVVVTAQRIKQPEFDVPYSITKVKQQYLHELKPRSTPDALQGVTGVFVQKTNHGGGSPFIRGLTGNQTLLLIDGIRLNNSTFRYGPNQYVNTIDPYMIDHMEIARGTGSVQYGTDALGGVVHVVTRNPEFSDKPGVGGRIIGKYMSGDMEKIIRGEADYHSEKAAITAGITFKNFGDLIGGDTTGRQVPSGYDEWAFNSKARFLLTENIRLTLAQQFLQQRHVPVYHKVKLENFRINEFDRQQRSLQYARLNVAGRSAWMKELEVTASWQQSREGRKSEKNASTTQVIERDKINTIGLTADLLFEMSGSWTANSGIELFRDKINSSRHNVNTQTGAGVGQRGLYPDGSAYGNYSLYTLHHFTTGRWVVDAGLRFNTFSIRTTDTTLGATTIHPSALVWNAALMYRLTTKHHVYFAYSTGYRAPNIDDMGTLGIVDFRYEVPTSDLSPEKSANMELGYKFNSERISGNFAVYHMQLSNLITRVKMDGEMISGYQVYRKENTEEAYIRGLEAELGWNITKGIDMIGGLAYTYGQNDTKGEPLRRIPPLNGRLMSTFRKENLFGKIEFLFASNQERLAQGDKEDNRIPAGGTPGWEVLNLYAGYSLGPVECNLGVQNIFNSDYRTHGSGINGVGRSVWVSASFTF